MADAVKTYAAIYSLADVTVSLLYTKGGAGVGPYDLSSGGAGRISISDAGDLASHTTTANGFVVINKLRPKSGTCTLEVPVNSEADKFLRSYISFVKNCQNEEFASGTLTVYDKMAGRTTTLNNIVPQKDPDEAYDQSSTNRSYQFLYADKAVTNA